ncbi:MAG TPA: hypothetical protein G4O02_18640 [Caldilineae bacterium]|nr:hypothetical protein [Caldilineae bacterium]
MPRGLLLILILFAALGGSHRPGGASADPAWRSYLPSVMARPPTCQPTGQRYATLSVNPPPTDRPAERHADLNLSLRGYIPVDAYKGLLDYPGGSDPNAPQLSGLFADAHIPTFRAVYQIYDWDWTCNCRGAPIANPAVTLAGLATAPGEIIHVPDSRYTIGDGYEVLVLYAEETRITLKYTGDDNVVHGYTLHLEHICVDPALLALYRTWNEAGRERLPALQAGQPLGRALGVEIGVAIRDSGAFMDPRSRKDWWRD